MSFSLDVLEKLLPLYLFVAVGFLATRTLRLPREPFSAFLIYLIAPLMVFASLLKTQVRGETLIFPFAFFILSAAIGIFFFKIRLFKGPTHNLFAFGSGNANTGYFGIPVTAALVGPEAVDLAILVAIGLIFYENTVGYYITSRSHFSARQALLRVFRLPTIYAAISAIIWRSLMLPIPNWFFAAGDSARATYSVLGFAMIGLSAAAVGRAHLDWKYVISAQLSKFALWPIAIAILAQIFQLLGISLSPQATGVLAVMAFVPMAANTVVFATLLKAEPEKAAVAVFISTLVALMIFSLGGHHWFNF
jgi:malate permease and related proteins